MFDANELSEAIFDAYERGKREGRESVLIDERVEAYARCYGQLLDTFGERAEKAGWLEPMRTIAQSRSLATA